MNTKKITILILTLFLISCGQKYYKSFFYDYGNLGTIQLISTDSYSEYIYNNRLNGALDKYIDTFGIYKIKLPLGIKSIGSSNRKHVFLYGRRKAIMIYLDYKSRNESPTFVQEEFNDSIFKLCPSFKLSDRQQRRIWPDNNKFTCKYLRRGNSRIYIFNFKEEESKKAIGLIQNSFQFLPWDTVIVKTYEKK